MMLQAFNLHFKEANKDQHLTTTIESAGYHSANAAVALPTKTSTAPRPSAANDNANPRLRSYRWMHGNTKNLKTHQRHLQEQD